MKVLCVGSNYLHHVQEMGGAAPPQPIWFWKPPSAIVGDGAPVVLPAGVGAIHHEVELAVRLGARARRVDATAAGRAIDAYTVAVDVTARDLQAQAKKEGHPWAQAKGYDTFLPLGTWKPMAGQSVLHLSALTLRLSLDGTVRQEGRTDQMRWSPARLVAMASQWTTLEPGDVVLTGTPEGVGPLRVGQRMVAEIVGELRLENSVEAA